MFKRRHLELVPESWRVTWQKHIRIAIVGLAVILFAFPVAAEMTAPDGDTAIKTFFTEEPVFSGGFYVVEAGMGKPESVVLVHGLGNLASGTWDKLIPELARRYHVVAFDLPGFGRSEKKNAPYSPTRYASLVKWVVERYVPGPFHLVGHSMGGAVALRFAESAPQRMRSLVLADAAGILQKAAFSQSLVSSVVKNHVSEELQSSVDSAISSVFASIQQIDIDSSLVVENALLRQKMLQGDPSKIVALALVGENFSKAVYSVKVPTLLLWGEADPVTPLRTAHLLRSTLGNARLVTIPVARHMPMHEQPKIFNAALLSFISSPPTTPPERPEPGERSEICRNIPGKRFEGSYSEIEIEDCGEVLLSNVGATSIRVSRSTVNMENVVIKGKGLFISNSKLQASGLTVEAERPLVIDHGQVDIAGAIIIGKNEPVTLDPYSTLLFSVSKVGTHENLWYRHGAWPTPPLPEEPRKEREYQ